MVAMIRAGETGGFLDSALDRIADELREGRQRSAARSSAR